MKEMNSINQLILGQSENASLKRTSLSTMLSSLNTLEDITSNHLTDRAISHFVKKAFIKAKDAERASRSKGGQTKAENYRAKMNPIFDELFNMFQNLHPVTAKKWKSKSECAKYFIKEFYLKNPQTEIDLDPKKLVAEITNRVNDRSASKESTFLALP